MKYPQLPIFAFFAALLVLVPLPWHWRAQNVATLALIFWLCFTNLIQGVNSIKWAGNLKDDIPVWCDITTKFTAGASYALPLCTLCICKHLEMVSSSRKASYTFADRQRRMIFEALMCFFVPVVFMALHYIVQGHRYDIIENIGCQAAVYISLPAVFLIWFPQLLFSFITLIYAALALHNFIRRRLTFAAHLQTSNSALTTNRYLRLIAMACMEMCWGTILTALNLANNVKTGLRPWTSWSDVHSNFGRVSAFPTSFLPERLLRTMFLFWWSVPASSFIFFLFFGFGDEAVKEYKRVGSFIWSKILRRNSVEKKKESLFGGSIPKSLRTPPRPLKLSSVHKLSSESTQSSPSRQYHDKYSSSSPTSQSSQSTITLATFSADIDGQKPGWKEGSSTLSSPTYTATSLPSSGSGATLLCQPIDTKRSQLQMHIQPPARLSLLPRIDASDAFSISSFSYYESGLPTSSSFATTTTTTSAAPSSTGAPSTSPKSFTLVPPTPPHPPSPRLTNIQHSLPPPPRKWMWKEPRAVGSISSLLSSAGSYVYGSGSRSGSPSPSSSRPTSTSPSNPFSYPTTQTQTQTHHTHHSQPLDVPEDVGLSPPSSYTLSGGLSPASPSTGQSFPEHDELAGLAPLSTTFGSRILGVQDGGILVTVQRQASVDRMA